MRAKLESGASFSFVWLTILIGLNILKTKKQGNSMHIYTLQLHTVRKVQFTGKLYEKH